MTIPIITELTVDQVNIALVAIAKELDAINARLKNLEKK